MPRLREWLIAGGVMLALLCFLGAVWLPYIPNELGHAAADYSFWLPNLLAGYFWYLHNGLFALPWFTPAECAGAPFQADPQIGYFSIPQWLSFITDPLSAVRISLFVYAAAGFAGAWVLARRCFAASLPAAVLAAGLFVLNGFFSARMAAGHLAFAPFMVLPAFCAGVLPGWPKPTRRAGQTRQAGLLLRSLVCGLLLAVMIQGGMVVLLPIFFLSVAAILLLHAALFGFVAETAMVLAAGMAVGLALCAGKLAASAALLSHFPRQNYPLPGLPGVFGTLYVAARSLFWPFSTDMESWIENSRLIQDPHEFAYGVGLAPPLLMLAAGVLAWRRAGWRALAPRRRGWALALALVLAIPLALNVYAPWWTALLKTLPVLSSSSNLLRWFAVLMLPAILGAALALDRLARGVEARGWALAAAALLVTLGGVAGGDRSAFGSGGMGVYDPTDITTAWQRAHDTGAGPPVRAVVQLFNPQHQALMIPDRQNGMAHGYSTLSCYDPLFGYRLENMPFGKIRIGLAMIENGGVLNFKNPACYVFPGANHCTPGDQFTVTQADALARFLDYRGYDFAKPLVARVADWVSLLALLSVPVGLGWGFWVGRRK
jgi:hypothetical protein